MPCIWSVCTCGDDAEECDSRLSGRKARGDAAVTDWSTVLNSLGRLTRESAREITVVLKALWLHKWNIFKENKLHAFIYKRNVHVVRCNLLRPVQNLLVFRLWMHEKQGHLCELCKTLFFAKVNQLQLIIGFSKSKNILTYSRRPKSYLNLFSERHLWRPAQFSDLHSTDRND